MYVDTDSVRSVLASKMYVLTPTASVVSGSSIVYGPRSTLQITNLVISPHVRFHSDGFYHIMAIARKFDRWPDDSGNFSCM